MYGIPAPLLQHTATHCNTLQLTYSWWGDVLTRTYSWWGDLWHTHASVATHYNALQHTATLCNTLQLTNSWCGDPWHTCASVMHCVAVCLGWFMACAHVRCNKPFHIWMSHDSSIRAMWHIHTCDMTHPYVIYGMHARLLQQVMSRIHEFQCSVLQCVALCCSVLQCGAVCLRARLMQQVMSRMHESCRICMSHVTYACECVAPHMNAAPTWMSHMSRMNHSCHTYECAMSHIWISHVTTDSWGAHDNDVG